MGGGETAIEVRGLSKSFRITSHRKDTLKERAVKPLARPEHHELHALRDVSFDVARGEFFGVVGRNGSGKSTLLKLLASIYRADRGEIRVAGTIAPFIELAVGFNLEFTAYENVLLNGVMMGLSRKEAEHRFDAVMDFAELEEYGDLKLKNYSSGMLTRLAFSIMVQVDADVMLIDEVLAVGDASFQRKCGEVFDSLRGSRTIVFVTHDMTAVERYCHRAMLIDEGRVAEIGDPHKVARSYIDANAAPRRSR
jgi:ABC-2 type transport system ATP-binding protein